MNDTASNLKGYPFSGQPIYTKYQRYKIFAKYAPLMYIGCNDEDQISGDLPNISVSGWEFSNIFLI